MSIRDTIMSKRKQYEQQKENEKDIKRTEKKWETFNQYQQKKNKRG